MSNRRFLAWGSRPVTEKQAEVAENNMAQLARYLQRGTEKTANMFVDRNKPAFEQMQGKARENWQHLKGNTHQGLKQMSDQANNRTSSLKGGAKQGANSLRESSQQGLESMRQNAQMGMTQLRHKTDDLRAHLQENYVLRQQKRRRDRQAFRFGLFVGVTLALFYTPWAGGEIRRRLLSEFQSYRETLTRS